MNFNEALVECSGASVGVTLVSDRRRVRLLNDSRFLNVTETMEFREREGRRSLGPFLRLRATVPVIPGFRFAVSRNGTLVGHVVPTAWGIALPLLATHCIIENDRGEKIGQVAGDGTLLSGGFTVGRWTMANDFHGNVRVHAGYSADDIPDAHEWLLLAGLLRIGVCASRAVNGGG